ncbi:LacI family DNA-binding transcriptional regulator [Paenibacillus spongiae]|uniref:LacI family transcriptional regulator n=1 Tax=Paenibacillus spongiae TaxID=2909671 RepID=A0ABY5S6E4_9BACL|nr:LacI family DNA-binding transcriptional regulator [Paenibacillus spongiae]UVI29284.1 LacI family transcriptional regulator [Paenibacillus spongiae]
MDGKQEIRRKSGIKEIADLTGFSPTTVSLVLNNKGTFSDQTKQTIHQAFAELNYDRAVSEGRQFIRLLIEESSSSLQSYPYNSEIIQAVESECRRLGYEIILTFVRETPDPVAWLENVSGLILVGGGLITDELVEELRQSGLPLVLVDNYSHRGDVLSVHSDHYGAGYMATEYLIGQGHERIGFIGGPAKYKPLVNRYAGYCAALMAHGLPFVPEYVAFPGDRKYIKGYDEMKSLIALPERPGGVFAVSDKSAFGALQALRDMALEPGRDVQLIGCDNIQGQQEIFGQIPTVHVPRVEVGVMAVRFLIEAMKGNLLQGKIVIPGKLILPSGQ